MSERTFHPEKGDLHGYTVAVEARGDRLYIGRCDEVRAEGVVLLDADLHEGAEGRDAYLKRALDFGVWKKFDRLLVPRPEVESIRKLSELESTGS